MKFRLQLDLAQPAFNCMNPDEVIARMLEQVAQAAREFELEPNVPATITSDDGQALGFYVLDDEGEE